MQSVLFICTGNYYRSRFAEAVFNHEAVRRKLKFRAYSRGLATWLVDGDGPISPHTLAALKKLNIPLGCTGKKPTPLTSYDLVSAYRIVALKEAEHRPMMEKQFPEWAAKIEYWGVHDIDFADPVQALPQIHDQVLKLIESLPLNHSKLIRKTKKNAINRRS
jgi:protein-tyrosine phosphatase